MLKFLSWLFACKATYERKPKVSVKKENGKVKWLVVVMAVSR